MTTTTGSPDGISADTYWPGHLHLVQASNTEPAPRKRRPVLERQHPRVDIPARRNRGRARRDRRAGRSCGRASSSGLGHREFGEYTQEKDGPMAFFTGYKTTMPRPEEALKGREATMPVADRHAVNGTPLVGPFPAGLEQAMFGLGCFWGAERKFWQAPGVYTTAVGYAGGYTKNPTYEEVCSGRTGHNEVVLVVFDPTKISLRRSAQAVLGGARSHAGHAARERRRHAVPLGDLRVQRRAAPGGRAHSRQLRGRAQGQRASRRSPPRSSKRRRSTTRRTTTSSTSRRIRAATAASAARASAAVGADSRRHSSGVCCRESRRSRLRPAESGCLMVHPGSMRPVAPKESRSCEP